ncbi:MAG TPA: CDP-alcohol phosphatidyltransferase family protein, partial [Solirubrobacteraceae bacterium]|nr:CDP-alcohol phosphatidyltransferase family protein [Solirubrobacteraceae bacterium]
ADYLDGFAARLTGQYSRLGALLDPVIDRLLVICGMAVCFDFSLLPRWAIGVVVARELFMLFASRYGLRRGIDIKINWAGRLGVAPIMGAPFFAMAGVHWLALVMLYVGLALALTATVLYVRRGVAQLSAAGGPPGSQAPDRPGAGRPRSPDIPGQAEDSQQLSSSD